MGARSLALSGLHDKRQIRQRFSLGAYPQNLWIKLWTNDDRGREEY